MPAQHFDYVIIGAGSAGCVLANRLSADGRASVLLLEAGGRDWNPLIHMPAGIARLVDNQTVDWGFYTEPQQALNGRRLYWPRGRVLGGSSSINAMCYTRGHARDYDEWHQLGAVGWDYASVLPYFLRAENQARGAGPFHGVGGPLDVEDLRYRNPLSDVFVAAANAAGHPLNADFNGAQQCGAGYYQVTQRAGRRCSSAVAYLRPARSRSGLTVRTGCLVHRVLIRDARAEGVEYQTGTQVRRAFAQREVLVCAGAVGSPQLLLLSGVGPASALEALGIRVQADRRDVGEHLQDHLDFCTLRKCTRPVTYDFGLWGELGVGARYLLTRSGPGVSNVAEAGAFIRSALAPDERPDIQLHFVPAQLDDHGRHRLPGHGFTVHGCALRPLSRGRLRLRSADPAAPPLIDPAYLQAPVDAPILLEAIRLSREILAQHPFDAFRGEEVYPGADASSADSLLEILRRKAETIYHPVGTCRMGSDAEAVVDPRLRVQGVDRLRVIDASVMPRLIGGNTNAPTIMIAERGAQWLLDAR